MICDAILHIVDKPSEILLFEVPCRCFRTGTENSAHLVQSSGRWCFAQVVANCFPSRLFWSLLIVISYTICTEFVTTTHKQTHAICKCHSLVPFTLLHCVRKVLLQKRVDTVLRRSGNITAFTDASNHKIDSETWWINLSTYTVVVN
jgi:hypothetical protein